MDLAIMMGGYVSVPIYPSLSASHIREIAEHSEAKAILFGKLDNPTDQKGGIPADCKTIGIAFFNAEGDATWEDICSSQEPTTALYQWDQDEICTIIYTSGTTGKSKGVMHRVGAFEDTLKVIFPALKLPHHPKLFSYLPLCHIAERVGIENYGIRAGSEISFAESLDTFGVNLAATEPSLFVAVPRIWTKFRDGVLKKIPQKRLDILLSIPLIKNVIAKSIRKKMGLDNASIFLTGAAPIAVALQEWFKKIGIEILQVYGMTEDCVYAHMNLPGKNKFGTVGMPLEGLQVKIHDDGEIRVKSAGLFKGYYKEPTLTAEAFDEDGFLCTGDVGEYDEQGYLSITGRVKDQFKTDKGKYVAPAPIELLLQSSTLIEQACVVGTGLPQPICLLVLSESGKELSRPEVESSLAELLDNTNAKLEKVEQLKKGVVVNSDWTVDNEFLTPSLKLKRHSIEREYQRYFLGWYQSEERICWQ